MKTEQRKYSPRGHTYTPCPACKDEPRIYYKKGDVCDDCKELLRDGHAYQAMREKMRSLQDDKKALYILPDNWCKPTFYSVKFWHAFEEESEKTGMLLKKLAYLFAESVEKGYKISIQASGARALFIEPNRNPQEFDHISLTMMRKDVAETLDELYLTFHALLNRVGQAGYEHGSNVLAQLASGEMSVVQFNEESQKIKNTRR